jgi:RimJ/RimL family protein N-acetyltransferase
MPAMSTTPELRTARLRLRAWEEADLEPLARMSSDPRVMEYLPGMLSREQAAAMLARITAHFAEHGFGLWAVEVPGVAPFIGGVGLAVPRFEAAFMPCVEVGWRLAAEHWGRGYATEAARAALAFGFDELGLDEIVSFTVHANQRSRTVMERLGMQRDPSEDFEHPSLPVGHPLRPHVLYRLRRAQRPP